MIGFIASTGTQGDSAMSRLTRRLRRTSKLSKSYTAIPGRRRNLLGQKGKFMQVQLRQIEGVRFAIESRTHTVICDQPVENGGADSGMTPPI